MGLVIGWDWEPGAAGGEREVGMGLAMGARNGPSLWDLGAGRTEVGREGERIHSWRSQPTRARPGLSGMDTPPRPLSLLCSQPKSALSLPSSLHGDPGAFPVSPAADGPSGGPVPQ